MAVVEHLSHIDQFPLPQTLPEARRMVLNLPGAQHYINSARERLSAARAEDEAVDTSEAALEEMALQLIVGEVIDEIDAANMQIHAKHRLGWSTQQADAFFRKEENRPFKSKIELSGKWEERKHQLLTVGLYLRFAYDEAMAAADRAAGSEEEEQKQKEANFAGMMFRYFFEYALENVFTSSLLAYEDKVNGIDPQDRAEGNIRPSEETLAVMRKAAVEVAGDDWQQLLRRMIDATEGGYFILVDTFLRNYKGDEELRRALNIALQERFSDPGLTRDKLRLVWQAETFRHDMGMSLDMLYRLSGLPEVTETISRMYAFLKQEDVREEAYRHLAYEVPDLMENWEEGTPFGWEDVLYSLARREELPDRPLTQQQLEEKHRDVTEEVGSLLPYADIARPCYYVVPTFGIGANPRAGTMMYYNEERDLVTIVGITPRVKLSRYRAIVGHEQAHGLHSRMLTVAAEHGYVPKRANMEVPYPVHEDFAQLAEEQVARILNGQSSLAGVHFEDAMKMLEKVRQAPYGIIQGVVRMAMDELRENRGEGRREPLSDEEVDRLIEQLQPVVEESYDATGFDYGGYASLSFNLDPTRPTDGTMYLGQYLRGSQPGADTGKEERIGFKQAYELRFGDEKGAWLDQRDARAVLMTHMVESGRNHDVTKDGSFVVDRLEGDELIPGISVSEAKQRLAAWGISEEQI